MPEHPWQPDSDLRLASTIILDEAPTRKNEYQLLLLQLLKKRQDGRTRAAECGMAIFIVGGIRNVSLWQWCEAQGCRHIVCGSESVTGKKRHRAIGQKLIRKSMHKEQRCRVIANNFMAVVRE